MGRGGCVTQMEEHLPHKCEALSSIPNTTNQTYTAKMQLLFWKFT
jgi:hypothetical protein